ncbi:MAG: metal-dependent hydrolase [Planctomycetaceae bacterium]
MTTQIRYIGHSTFEILTGSTTILIDPFFDENPSTDRTAADVAADVIIVTHGHFDHIADAASIARRTGATVVSNFEIIQWLQNQGVQNTHAMNIGGRHEFDFGTVLMTIAHHSSMLPDGSNGGNPAGFVLMLPDGNIYHAGDTGLFADMQLIGEENLEVAILPIGDNFTMGPADSLRAIGFLNPKVAIPCHFNTWPPIEQDSESWSASVRSRTAARPVVLQPGECHQL